MSIQDDYTLADDWFRGEDKIFFHTIAADPSGIANITGWDIQWRLSDELGGVAILIKTAVVVDGPNGICAVTIESADTLALDAGTYFYTLRRIDVGSRAELSYGTALLQEVYVA